MKLNIPYDDLRSWLDLAGEIGEVCGVEGAGWQEDIGMAAELLNHSDPAPATVFDKIPGYPQGHRVLVNFFGGRRKNMTLGLPPQLSNVQLSEGFTEAFQANTPIPYEFVEDGPILENVQMGDDVNVLSFPTPLWHELDGGRYIGTGSFNITKDPDEDWVNLGTYRVMVHDEKSVGFYISPGKHGRVHRDKYIARGEPMPAAIVVGGDPLLFLMTCTEIPYGVSEYEVAGGLRGKPCQVIKGKVTGLPIPANAEIVLEGYIDPKKNRPEGPFGEWTGYYGSGIREEPYMDVKAVYYRNNPIMLGCPPQRPPDEISRYRSILRSGLLKEALNKAGLSGIKGAWASECGNTRMLLTIAIEQRYAGHATQVGHVASQCHVGAYAGKYVVVVDDDIDVSNLEEVVWAMITRSDPATSIDIIRNAWSTPLDPRIPPEDRAKGQLTNSRAIIDATRPYAWRDQFPPVNMPSPEIARKAREKFSYLLEGRK
ncbi:MAG: UbiD family decarboxylase [Candidatus Binatia bacterium]|jgi:4-hydroxy-3-polyprenylbenzoate decarboxylase|nr:UbiD family decarboxylase [Candidatus Binatia bacterium]